MIRKYIKILKPDFFINAAMAAVLFSLLLLPDISHAQIFNPTRFQTVQDVVDAIAEALQLIATFVLFPLGTLFLGVKAIQAGQQGQEKELKSIFMSWLGMCLGLILVYSAKPVIDLLQAIISQFP